MNLSRSSIIAIIGALAADELAALRRTDAQLWKGRQWQADSVITTSRHAKGTDNELLVDSFEWMSIASRVVDFFHIHSSGLEDYLLRVSRLGEWADVVMASREHGSKDITFCSSGSTAKPQKYQHRWRELEREVAFFSDYLNGTSIPFERVVSAVPPHHIYGFIFSVLLAEALELPVLRGLAAFSAVQGQRLQDGDLLIGFPHWYQQLAKRPLNFPRQAMAVCSTGPVAAEVLQQLLSRGLHSVLEVYGSSETSGLGFRTLPGGWYELLPRWQRQDLAHVADIETAQVMALPDRLEWQDERHFKPLARRDKAVQVNGYNVYPTRIAQLIATHPTIADARVRPLAAEQGGGLTALLIPSAAATSLSAEDVIEPLRHWLAQQVTDAEMPRRFHVAASVPVNEMGKEVDWEQQPIKDESITS
ncbi:hypothetical protein C5610_07815 [Idiomarina sp. OT37-5b]|jgi:4-coumarate--CoA ligase (photoactive yellow protein activation family)|uniref:AMP-binding protein n=1 Tax=Idiomarina sp. OT37-5b TaxID=2100422 RepID=UPI000CF9FEB7|nr:AMP-binding protein [Idiomarina sp. OT37-5b]AVJ56227.1 hypothetical protein C5610_07815 [Idiomarina sp. OT37-5b]